MLLKVGRHLRPAPHFKLIVAREDGENNFLMGYRRQFAHVIPLDHGGPFVLVDGKPTTDDLLLAARIGARFGQARDREAVLMEVTDAAGVSRQLQVAPLKAEEIPAGWYL